MCVCVCVCVAWVSLEFLTISCVKDIKHILITD